MHSRGAIKLPGKLKLQPGDAKIAETERRVRKLSVRLDSSFLFVNKQGSDDPLMSNRFLQRNLKKGTSCDRDIGEHPLFLGVSHEVASDFSP